MKKIAIQDANILIDLVKTGLLDHCLSMEFHFTTTDIILDELFEEQAKYIQPHISSGSFSVIAITGEEMYEIQLMSQEDTRLSEQDWSAYYFAVKLDAVLLTGDKRLKEMAGRKGIEVSGILWLLDQLVLTEKLSPEQACEFLDRVYEANNRLPADEYKKRKSSWNKTDE